MIGFSTRIVDHWLPSDLVVVFPQDLLDVESMVFTAAGLSDLARVGWLCQCAAVMVK